MELKKAIYARRTVREFEDKPIDKQIVKKIIDCGLQAPTNDHMRRWEFLIIDDQERKRELIGENGENLIKRPDAKELVDNWGLTDVPQRECYLYAIPRQAEMILNAPIVIIPCFYQPTPLLEPVNLSSLNEFASIWLCIENILLAATDEGIFGVTRIPHRITEIKTLFNIPPKYEIPCILPLGYPKKNISILEQPNIDTEKRMRFNSWA
jgi:nitroreductase